MRANHMTCAGTALIPFLCDVARWGWGGWWGQAVGGRRGWGGRDRVHLLYEDFPHRWSDVPKKCLLLQG